jgi:hypothetical protein
MMRFPINDGLAEVRQASSTGTAAKRPCEKIEAKASP